MDRYRGYPIRTLVIVNEPASGLSLNNVACSPFSCSASV